MATHFSKQEGEICKTGQAGALQYYFTSEAQIPTYVEVLLLFTHCRCILTKSCTLRAGLQTDAAPMFYSCQNSTALTRFTVQLDKRSW